MINCMRELLVLRIISGTARGTKLVSIDSLDTRPTLDRVKEALFSSITPYVANSTVLDLFAGSGALGLESLSRGALSCDFIDNNIKCKETINTNIKKTHMEDKSNVHICDFHSFLNRCNKKYDLVFLDPPYHLGIMGDVLQKLKPYLSDNAIIVAEVLKGTDFNHNGYEVIKEKTYGKVSIFVLGKELV